MRCRCRRSSTMRSAMAPSSMVNWTWANADAPCPPAPDGRRVTGAPLRGVALGCAVRSGGVGARDAVVGHVLGPLGPRPVPLAVPEEGIGEPAGRRARPGRRLATRALIGPGGSGLLRVGRGEGTALGVTTGPRAAAVAGELAPTSPSTLGVDVAEDEEADEDQHRDPRTIAVIHGSSVRRGISASTPRPTQRRPVWDPWGPVQVRASGVRPVAVDAVVTGRRLH